jgi:hypothetical protein
MKDEEDRLKKIEEKLDDIEDIVSNLYSLFLAINEKVIDKI